MGKKENTTSANAFSRLSKGRGAGSPRDDNFRTGRVGKHRHLRYRWKSLRLSIGVLVQSPAGCPCCQYATDIETICQSIEGVFSLWKQKKISQSPELFDTLHAIETIRAILSFCSKEDSRRWRRIRGFQNLYKRFFKPRGRCNRERRNITPDRGTGVENQTIIYYNSRSPFSEEGQRGVIGNPGVPLTKEHPALSETVRISTAKLGSLPPASGGRNACGKT